MARNIKLVQLFGNIMTDSTDTIADNLIAERGQQTEKTSPDLWVVLGMAAQWLIEQFGANIGISYETVASWASTISEMTRDTDGGSMTVVAALVWGAGRVGKMTYDRYKNR